MNDPITPARVWLITGCSSGLGLALATKLLERGQMVIATARHPDSIDHLVTLYPESCRTFALDVTDSAQVKAVCVQNVEEKKCGRVSLLQLSKR